MLKQISALILFLFLLPIFGRASNDQMVLVKDVMGIKDISQILSKINELEQKKNKNIAEYCKLSALYHNNALYTQKFETTEKMTQKIEEIYKYHKDNSIISGFYGSILTMMGRDVTNPVNKMSYVKKGLVILDEAVDKNPDNAFLRITRGQNNAKLPEFFKRIEYAKKDFEWLIKLHQNNNPDINKSMLSNVYFSLAEINKRQGDMKQAIQNYKKAVETDSQSDSGKKAKEMLDLLED